MCNLIIVLPLFSLPIMPRTFGLALHINESQSRHMLSKYIPEYLIGRGNYLYAVLYLDAAIFIGGTVMVATGLMIAAYFKHACGLLKIAR